MVSKTVLLLYLLGTAVHAKFTTPSTSCTHLGGHNTHTRYYTRTSGCTNYITRTKKTQTTTQPATTSTVYSTSTITASTSTNTATETDFTTVTDTVTSTPTDTVTVTAATPTSTSTVYIYPTNGGSKRDVVPVKREDKVPERPTHTFPPLPSPSSGTFCVINRCVRRKTTSTITSTSTLSTTTETSTSTVLTTVTPNASTTVTVTNTTTSQSTVVGSATTTTQTPSPVTVTTTAQATLRIQGADSNPKSNFNGQFAQISHYSMQGADAVFFDGNNGTEFVFDPNSNELALASNGYIAAGVTRANIGLLYFADPAALQSYSLAACPCSIDPNTYYITCNCPAGNSTYTNGPSSGDIGIGPAGSLFYTVSLVANFD